MRDDDQGPVLFVSHHSSKLQIAEHVEKALAARGVRCWIAPHNVEPGESFDLAVHRAIGETDAMLLLFCSRSEESRHVKRELILADQQGKAIIPLRLERIDPGKLAYHLADSQWIDWLEQRDDVIDRIAAKAREFRAEKRRQPGHGASGGEAAVSAGQPVDLADAAPSHSAAIGAASDLQPHALGAFPGPAAVSMPTGQPGPGFGPGGYGSAGAPVPPPQPPAGRSNALRIGLIAGALVAVIAVGIAVWLATRGSGATRASPAVTAAAEASAPVNSEAAGPLTVEMFAGVWADERECRRMYRFDPGGQLTDPNGNQAQWSIENGDTLVVENNGTRVSKRLEVVSNDELIGEAGHMYRCLPG